MEYLLDKNFLAQLDRYQHKEVYARIISLDLNELPLEAIEGKVTQGSLNIDGSSALRRTCNLTLVAKNLNITKYYWGLNTRFKLEIGLRNDINSKYPEIIWFPQGIYLITSFNTSQSINNFTVTINGKDKMCLLNGEVGGNLHFPVDFGVMDQENEDGSISHIKIPIKQIIIDAVHQYGGEPFHNIFVDGLDKTALELLEYRGDVDAYIFRSITNLDEYINITLDESTEVYVGDRTDAIPLSQLGDWFNFDDLNNLAFDAASTIRFEESLDAEKYTVAKISYGQSVGYRLTDLTYAGDLILQAGETLTAMLDKIVAMLTDFEYFYDLDGKFVFRQKRINVDSAWGNSFNIDNKAPISLTGIILPAKYSFTNSSLVTAYTNTPDFNNLKNDYTVWGKRKSVSGEDLPIHIRYAIDTKPNYYKAYDGRIYTTDGQVYEELKQKEKQNIIDTFYDKIRRYELEYAKDMPPELVKPTKNPDGSWSPGWWDIRDWYNYYVVLTEEIPSYTMKWYSRNDINGCVPISDITNNINSYQRNYYCWLIIRNKDGSYNFQHGSGNPNSGGSMCTLYHSYYIDKEKGEYKTEYFYDQNGKKIQKRFIYPYAGCSDNHTYIEFLEKDIKKNGNLVYFYNPDFPDYDSYEDLISDRVEQEYEKIDNLHMINYVDWREIIYQMAIDYRQHNHDADYEIKLAQNNPQFPYGKTGYEQYYIDLEGFWRQLYDYEHYKVSKVNSEDWFNEGEFYTEFAGTYTKATEYKEGTTYYEINYGYGWKENVFIQPEQLNFWIDFLDFDGILSQFNIRAIGDRPKVINDSNVKAIYYKETPNLVFYNTNNPNYKKDTDGAYTYINIANNENLFSISTQGKSGTNKIDELIYQHGYCAESVNITCIPIYYLEPNIRINVYDENSNINGQYIISRMTIPLTYNGTMQITATKAPPQLY